MSGRPPGRGIEEVKRFDTGTLHWVLRSICYSYSEVVGILVYMYIRAYYKKGGTGVIVIPSEFMYSETKFM